VTRLSRPDYANDAAKGRGRKVQSVTVPHIAAAGKSALEPLLVFCPSHCMTAPRDCYVMMPGPSQCAAEAGIRNPYC